MKFSSFRNTRTGNIIVIVLSAVLGVTLSILMAFLVIKSLETAVNPEISVYSEISSEVSSESPPLSVPTVAEPNVVFLAPNAQNITVTQPQFIFKGTVRDGKKLLLGETVIETDPAGNFSHTADLKIGKNKFTFICEDESYTYTVNYRYIVINAYNPNKSFSVYSGTSFTATVNARVGSANVTATFMGQTVNLTRQTDAENKAADDFCDFSGTFSIAEGTVSNKNLGAVTFSATFNGITETFKSQNIICKDPIIAEITAQSAETFNGNSRDNMTRPTNNYLPKGTVDYVTDSFSMYDGGYKNNFLCLASGRRIYSDMITTPGKTRVQVAKTYIGKLPDHNEISVSSVTTDSRRTYITLDVMWKAPFTLDYKPQNYSNPARQDYTVSAFTAQYIEIGFCYATVFSGDISFGDNPLFSHAQIVNEGGTYKARLYLKKAGAFYGWDCYYNSAGKLVFEFLNPISATHTDTNEYGADLTGIKILVDAGHGGVASQGGDPGAVNGNLFESERNLHLAFKIKAELEKCGATVLMTRTGDTPLRSDNRVNIFRNTKADFCVSVHHNSFSSSSANGFLSSYTTPFSKNAAQFISEETSNSGIYSNNKITWHYFYMSRMTFCPTVLTENGYIKGSFDAPNIASDDVNTEKAKAIARGIARYYLSVG